MQLRRLGRYYPEPAIILRQIHGQELIALFTIINPGKPHFFYNAVLECSKQPLNSTLSLGRIGMDDFHSKLVQASFELAHELSAR